MGRKKKKRPSPDKTFPPLAHPLIDSHCHLVPHVYHEETETIVARTFAAGIERVVNIGAGYGMAGNEEVLRMYAQDRRLHPVVGIHPHDARLLDAEPDSLAVLSSWLSRPEVVALGEVGLDYYYDLSPRPVQIRALEKQLELAHVVRKPVVVHVRDADRDLLDVLDNAGAWSRTVIIHCFSSDWTFARECLDRGACIGISGIVTFKNAGAIKEVAARIPDERLLIETDSPYLAPTPFRGKTNEPSLIHATAHEVARLRHMDVEALASLTTKNACRVFRLPR